MSLWWCTKSVHKARSIITIETDIGLRKESRKGRGAALPSIPSPPRHALERRGGGGDQHGDVHSAASGSRYCSQQPLVLPAGGRESGGAGTRTLEFAMHKKCTKLQNTFEPKCNAWDPANSV